MNWLSMKWGMRNMRGPPGEVIRATCRRARRAGKLNRVASHGERLMKRAACLLLCLTVTAFAADKGTTVDFDGLKSTTPANWKEAPSSSRLRLATFIVPKAKGDDADADLAIFKGITGSKKQNLERWQGQFIAPEGKKIADVTKVEEMKVAGC